MLLRFTVVSSLLPQGVVIFNVTLSVGFVFPSEGTKYCCCYSFLAPLLESEEREMMFVVALLRFTVVSSLLRQGVVIFNVTLSVGGCFSV